MLPTLHAEQQLETIEAASVPHLKEQAQRDTIRKYRRAGFGTERKAAGLAEALGGVPMRRIEVPTRKEGGRG